MFFMIGITEGSREFDHTQTVMCAGCGRYGRYIVFMTYTVLSLFFIPCFKWNKQYFVRMSCCGKIYRLDPEIGKRISRGEEIEICREDLEEVDFGYSDDGISRRANWTGFSKTCPGCGYEADQDFEYCPKCGRKL